MRHEYDSVLSLLQIPNESLVPELIVIIERLSLHYRVCHYPLDSHLLIAIFGAQGIKVLAALLQCPIHRFFVDLKVFSQLGDQPVILIDHLPCDGGLPVCRKCVDDVALGLFVAIVAPPILWEPLALLRGVAQVCHYRRAQCLVIQLCDIVVDDKELRVEILATLFPLSLAQTCINVCTGVVIVKKTSGCFRPCELIKELHAAEHLIPDLHLSFLIPV